MPKGISFNFGANRKPKKPRVARGSKPKKAGSSRGKSNAWRQYVGSNAPIPD